MLYPSVTGGKELCTSDVWVCVCGKSMFHRRPGGVGVLIRPSGWSRRVDTAPGGHRSVAGCRAQ